MDAMEQGDQEGMQTFDGVLEKLIRGGVVAQEVALPYATNANNLLLRLADLGGKGSRTASPEKPKSENGSMLDMIE